MAVTRIKNNQITDATVVANAKLVDYSISSAKLANDLVYNSNFTVSGNLTVSGNTTTIDTTITTIEDPVIVLASTQTTGSPTVDIGFLGYRGNQSNIAFVWDESADEFVTVFTSTGETNTTVTITSYANFHTNDANIGGNIVINGTTSLVGNIVGAVSFTGNVTAGNLLTPGQVSATGNITGGNINTAGAVSATGNVTGGNVNTAGAISATGNITGGNIRTAGAITATGNIQGGNIISGNAVIGNINVSGDITVNSLTSNTYVSAGGNVIGANITTAGLITATGTITGGNLATAGTVSATSNVTGGNILTGGLISATSTITSAANVIGGNITTAGVVTATGNVTGGNILTGGIVSATGNVIADNVVTDNVVSTGALTLTTGSNGNINIQPNGTGNIVLSNTYINSVRYPVQDQDAASKIYVDNLVSTAISYHEAVFVATTTTLASTTGGTITYNQPGGAGNGIGATLTTTGSFNLIDTANVQTANTRILVKDEANAAHNGVYVWSNATVITRSTDTNTYGAGNVDALGINDYFYTTNGNVNKGTAFIVDAPTGTITFGTSNIQFAIFSQSQVYSANTDAGLSLVGTQFNAKVDNNTTAFDIGGNIIVKAGANLTTPNIGAATGTSLSVTGNVTGGNVNTAGLITATGNVTGGNILTAGLISATSTITSAANITGANLVTGGLVTATGNVTGGNITTAGLITATGNITGGNITTAGLITATGNITGGNLLYGSGIVSGTGNIYANNIFANISGNIDAGGSNTEIQFNDDNLLSGSPGFTFNKVGNVVTANGNITGANLITGGLITATGNITGANLILTSGTIDGPASGRITINGADADVDFAVDGDTLSNVFYVDAGTGTASFGSSTQVTNAVVNFATTNSVKMPVGNTAQRPATGVTGMLRFNTTDNNLEIYNNSAWEAVGVPAFTVIADEQFNGDGSTLAFTLSSSQTTNSCIVSINGVVQIPTIAYSVSGTTLTFTEAPLTGDLIDVRQITTTTSVTSISNSSGNAEIGTSDTSATVTVTGNLIPTGNLTQTLGNATNRWSNLYVGGNTIFLGNLQLKEASANTFAVFTADGITQANIDAGAIDVSAITSGTSTIGIYGTGQGYISVNGNANVLLASNTSVLVNGAFSATGNITGNYIFGNGSQLTGIDATSIQSGTSNVRVVSSGGNVATGVGGTSNVVVVATTGQFVTGVNSVSGNVTGGNILTAGVVSATGNITGNYIFGNGSQLTGIDATSIQNGTANVRTFLNGNVTTSAGGTANVLNVTSTGSITTGFNSTTGNVIAGNVTTAGLISATGAITGANITGSNLLTAGIISATGNIFGGNALFSGNLTVNGNVTYINSNVVTINDLAINLANNAGNVAQTNNGGLELGPQGSPFVTFLYNSSANTWTSSVGLSAVGNVVGGNITTGGLISATGNVNGGNLNLTGNLVDTGALSIITGSNGNIALTPNGSGIVTVSSALSATGNITGGNLSVGTGTVSVGNIVNTNANGVGNIGTSATRFNLVFALASSAQYADLAEKYTADATYEAGTVVSFGGDQEVTISAADSDRRVAGVISTNPSFRMNDGLESQHTAMVALTGRVPTKVTGTVRKGDLMVSAGNGRARAEANPTLGTVIGKALENFDGTEGVIEVVVGRL